MPFKKIKNHSIYPLFLSLTSGVLLGLGWYKFSTYLIFVGLVPIFLLENHIQQKVTRFKTLKLWLYTYLGFSLWNYISIWWLWEAAKSISLLAWFANALLQTFPVLIVHFINRKMDRRFSMYVWITCWMAFEYLHIHWDLSWIWLNLGNVLGYFPEFVQWYEYTGVFGGTLWILICNVFFYQFLQQKKKIYPLVITSLCPIFISLWIYYYYDEKGKPSEVVVVQPNLDCYTEKFSYNAKTGKKNPTQIPYDIQNQILIDISKAHLTDTTEFLLFPETALHTNKNELNIRSYQDVLKIQDFGKIYPNLSILTGIGSYLIYGEDSFTTTSRYGETIGYYDMFNSALFLKDLKLNIYRKSKLVLGVETMPFQGLTKTLLYLGGLGGSLGKQVERTVFLSTKNNGLAPIICYESVYGEFITRFVNNGATLLGVITNDGWWGNTPGHHQHLTFSSLRAIENRRYLARSANTGISAFIDQRGNITTYLPYDIQGALRQTIYLNDSLTFYAQFGDYLGRIAAFMAITFWIYAFVYGLMKKL